MQKIVSKCTFLLFILIVISCSPKILKLNFAPGSDFDRLKKVKRVIVFDSNNSPTWSDKSAHFGTISAVPESGKYLSSMLREKILLKSLYQIVERNEIEKILSEHSIQLTGLVDSGTAVKIGNFAGADAVIVGEVFRAEKFSRMGPHCWSLTATIRMIDVQTGSILWVANINRGRESEGVFMEDTFEQVVDFECSRLAELLAQYK